MEAKKYKNFEMEKMLTSVERQLSRCDIIGYAAARNYRVLRDELSEYIDMRTSLVEQYGEPQLDDDGNPTGMIQVSFQSENYPIFLEKLEKFAALEHEPKLFKLKFEEAIGILSGSELLDLEWMFEE